MDTEKSPQLVIPGTLPIGSYSTDTLTGGGPKKMRSRLGTFSALKGHPTATIAAERAPLKALTALRRTKKNGPFPKGPIFSDKIYVFQRLFVEFIINPPEWGLAQMAANKQSIR